MNDNEKANYELQCKYCDAYLPEYIYIYVEKDF